MPIDWAIAAGLPTAELQDLLIDESAGVMAGLQGADEDAQLDRLEEPLRAMWLLNWLDFEVAQGSLLAYFGNSHGRHAALARELLASIGADRMADVLARAGRAHSAGELDLLTDEYWEAAELDGWGDKLDAYLGHQVRLLASRNT
jgi:hypothetical protein